MANRIIIVSNRLPFNVAIRKEQLCFLPSSGGLVSSLKSYIQKVNNSQEIYTQQIWAGTLDISENKFRHYFLGRHFNHENFDLYPVFIPKDVKDKYYNGFCNDTIWPLFHYFPSYAKFKEDYYEQYQKANQLFAELILKIYKPGDLIWIHDYHLMLLPLLLRRHIPDAVIGFFLHIPFPSFELFRLIPNQWRKDILNGLLGADLIGFHTNDYVQHFLKSVRQILGYDNSMRVILTPERSITADVFPISIDFEKFHTASKDPGILNERGNIQKRLKDIKTIISVDRLDYSKGIVNRLESFELLLEKYHEYRGKVTYLLCVVPSRDAITKYKENKGEIDQAVSRINSKFGSIDWNPIIYQYRPLNFENLAGLYLVADVALITPVRDGMNLVAKEFVASRQDQRGVLILSETAGAASELSEAIIVNPTDRKEIAKALHIALQMPVKEQIERNKRMQTRLKNYDVVKWAEDFILSLNLSKQKQEMFKVKEVNPRTEAVIIKNYSYAKNRLIFLDYDGTLTPFNRQPNLAVPGSELLELLKNLADDEKNSVVIISGRSMEILEDWFGGMSVHLVAEHGAFIKLKGSEWEKSINAKADWKEAVLHIMDRFTERCAGSFVEEKMLSVAWHYRNSEKELAFVRSRELVNSLNEMSSQMEFQYTEGNKVIEAKPRGIDKGMAAAKILDTDVFDFVLAIGDDRTDEDLFKAMPQNAITIRVGLVSSAAGLNMKGTHEVLALLSKLQLSSNEIKFISWQK